jgi:outer membrane receptor protein involved in Fe transport
MPPIDAAPPPEPPVVEAVVVRAARLPPPLGEAAFAVERIEPLDLQEAERLDAALKRVPGVSLFRRTDSLAANPTTQGLSLRSIAPSGAGRALVTLDGVPQNDPFGGWVIWSALPPEAIGAAAVVRGTGAGPYGAGALTGVVELQERAGPPGGLSLDASAGERGSLRAAATADPAVGAGDLLLVAAGERSDGWVPVRRGRGAADAPLTLETRIASARFSLDAGAGVLAARLSAYDEDRGTGVAGGRAAASGQAASLTWAAAPGPDRDGWRLQAWARHSDFSQLSLAVAPGRATATPANDQHATPADGVGFNAAWRRARADWSWELGVDARAAEGETRERFRFLAGAFTRDRVAGGANGVAGLYLEGARRSGPWLVAAGLRLDAWKSWNGRRIETDATSGAVTFAETPADREGVVPTARIGLRRDLGAGLYLRTAAYSGFRPPTLNELHRPFRVGNDVTESNPGLEPERLYGLEAAVGGEAWSATAFWNRLDDAVTNVTVGVGPGTFPRAGFIPAGGVLRQRDNAGRIEAFGLEADVRWSLGERLTIRAAASAADARVDGGSAAPQLTGKRPAQAPMLTATAGARWRATDRLTVSADARYESRRFEDDLNSRVLAPSLSVDARAAWRLTPAAELWLAADNLFDAAVETAESADGTESFGAPRTLRVGISVRR